MKKILLLLLTFVGMVSTASADKYLKGDWDEWTLHKLSLVSGNIYSVTVTLSANSEIHFGIDDEGTFYKNGGTMKWFNCTNWEFTSSGVDCTIKTADAGSYTFTWDTSTKKLSISFPTVTKTIYLCNNLKNWTGPYAYILGESYWDNTNGSGSYSRPDGIAMTQISTTNIWKADFQCPSNVTTCDIAFLKTQQDNYGNFYNTEVILRKDFNISSPLFVSNGTASDTEVNGCTYYSNGEWHAYPTYTRSVTSGNWGTLCLPFAADISGANVYTIQSTVGEGDEMTAINLEAVAGNTVAAGKPYIFQATSDELTATYTGSYAAASADFGMTGNISSTPVNVEEDYYVIKNNKVKKVVDGGSGVTCGQYRAYITLEGISPATSRGAVFLGLDDNETTGIKKIENGELKNGNPIFNLAGQRIANPTKGLYIVNGKKVIK